MFQRKNVLLFQDLVDLSLGDSTGLNNIQILNLCKICVGR